MTGSEPDRTPAGAEALAAHADALAAHAEALAAGIEAALPGWVVRSVRTVMSRWQPALAIDPETVAAAESAGAEAQREVGAAVRRLLSQDIDEQRTTPLALLRVAVSYPTAVLRHAGAPPVTRDNFSERSFPDDVYNLSPSSLAEFEPGLVEVGISWGAAKAFVHKARHRERG